MLPQTQNSKGKQIQIEVYDTVSHNESFVS